MIAYFNCTSGISGDMILGALVDAGVPLDILKKELSKLPVRGYELKAKKVKRGGLRATKVDVVIKRSGVRGQGSANPAFLLPHPRSPIPVSVIPGVPAFCAAASLLGAPLMHDFASMSLSDLLTPWETIKKRLEMASAGDFVIILYNPKSKTRVSQLEEAVAIISAHRNEHTPVGIVKNATREEEEMRITTLKQMSAHYDFIDMATIVIIGNSSTFIAGDKMITPRGYDV